MKINKSLLSKIALVCVFALIITLWVAALVKRHRVLKTRTVPGTVNFNPIIDHSEITKIDTL